MRRYGTNRSGTSRCYCNNCRHAFTLNPRPRQLDETKSALILSALEEKTPVTAICRMFKVSPKTVYALMRGSKIALLLVFGAEENFWKRDLLATKAKESLEVRLGHSKAATERFVEPRRAFSEAQNRLYLPLSLLASLPFL